jgi:hypothetical protein
MICQEGDGIQNSKTAYTKTYMYLNYPILVHTGQVDQCHSLYLDFWS